MSKYLLYGANLIENDKTMKDFALSLIKIIPDEDLKERSKAMEEDGEDPTYEDEYMERVTECLEYDISRTDIDYEELMCRYAYEIGPVLYELENQGRTIELPEEMFFSSYTIDAFQKLVYHLVWLLKFCDDKAHPYFAGC